MQITISYFAYIQRSQKPRVKNVGARRFEEGSSVHWWPPRVHQLAAGEGQTFVNTVCQSAAAAFQLLKKTLLGRAKKLVKKMFLQAPNLLKETTRKEKEYTNVGQLAVLRKK
jgi:hypothetical protein